MTGIVMPSTCSQDRFAFISNMYKLGTKRAKYEQEMILMTISHRNSAGKTGANFSLYLEIFTCLDIHLESSHTIFIPSNLHTGSGKVQVNLTNGDSE
jgi:hypothetical protein